ncbi:MAG: DUF4352 domain-containing protein, partial [Infirmifilum sp.]
AVTIAVAIAVAFWMTGIVGLFTGFEQLQIVSAIPQWDSANNQWNINVTVKNSGTSAASPDILYINNVPVAGTAGTCNDVNVYFNSTTNRWQQGAQTIPAGSTITIKITLPNAQVQNLPARICGGAISVDHGVSLEIKLHTASGKDYPKLVVLP